MITEALGHIFDNEFEGECNVCGKKENDKTGVKDESKLESETELDSEMVTKKDIENETDKVNEITAEQADEEDDHAETNNVGCHSSLSCEIVSIMLALFAVCALVLKKEN